MMRRRDLRLLERGADLARRRLLAPVIADLVVNSPRAHENQQRDSAKDERGNGHRLAPAFDERLFALRANERRILRDADVFHAASQEATGVVGAFPSAGHGET